MSDQVTITTDYKRRLIWHGMFLFLLGLLTGLAEAAFKNPRMGLAAHLQGVMNGTFLVALGAIWNEVRLSPRQSAVAFWTALHGTYANWGAVTLAAIWGTNSLSPITGAGFAGLPWQETIVLAILVTVGIAIILATLLVLWGLRHKR